MSFESGLEAFNQNKFEDAIAHLTQFCQECEAADSVTSQKYMQAHRGIVKCYQQLGQLDEAIAHCQPLKETKNTALGIWIDRTLPKLEAEAEEAKRQQEAANHAANNEDEVGDGTVIEMMPSHNEQDNEVLLHQGIQAYKNMKRDRAIQLLEQYTAACTRRGSRDYMNAQMTLVKAYREVKAFEKAIARCEELANSDNFALKSWASKALPKLQSELAEANPPAATSEPVAEPSTPASTPANKTPSPARSTHPASSAHPAQTQPVSSVATQPGLQQVSSSTYVFDATPHGVTRSPHSATNSPSPTRTTSTRTTSTRTTSTRTTPTRTTSTRRTSSSRSQSSNSKAAGGAALLGGGILAVLGQFFFKRALRSGLGFAVFVVIVLFRTCFGGGITVTSTPGEITPLQQAALEGDTILVEQLLNQGESIETTDESGNTLIFWALDGSDCDIEWDLCSMTANQQAVVDLLLNRGANVAAVNNWNETPLHWAAGLDGSLDVLQSFISQGADINARDYYDSTPLHRAAATGILENVTFLLDSGADINAKDMEGGTPLDYALNYAGNEDVVSLLKSREAVSGF